MRIVRYEFSRTLFGYPLISIAVNTEFWESGTFAHGGRAKGIIAIGDMARGFLAIGGIATGVIAIGGASFGLLSLGGAAFGLLAAYGGLTIGGVAYGGIAIGMLAIGGFALGIWAHGGLAIGVWAYGPVGIGANGHIGTGGFASSRPPAVMGGTTEAVVIFAGTPDAGIANASAGNGDRRHWLDSAVCTICLVGSARGRLLGRAKRSPPRIMGVYHLPDDLLSWNPTIAAAGPLDALDILRSLDLRPGPLGQSRHAPLAQPEGGHAAAGMIGAAGF